MRKLLASGLMLILLSSGSKAQLRFLGPPEISDRTVSWRWAAIPDDPVYTGNSTLKRAGGVSEIPFHDREIGAVLLDGPGNVGFSLTADGQEILRWDLETGIVQDTLAPLTGPVTVMAASLHEELVSLVAVLDDGRMALWDPELPDTVWTFPAHTGACYDVEHLPGVIDNRFVTVGADGLVLEWAFELEPGMPPPEPARDPPFEFRLGGEARTVDVGRNRRTLAAGSDRGEIRIWDLREGFLTAILREIDTGPPVTDVFVGFTGGTMVTADEDSIIIWNLTSQSIMTQFQPGDHGQARLSLTPPDDRLLLISYEDGTLEVRDGTTGQLFRSAAEGATVTAYVSHPDGSRVILGLLDGSLIQWSAGFCRPSPTDPVCFGGYKLWAGLAPEREAMELLRTYSFGDSSWTFAGRDTIRYFIDPDSVSRRGADPELELAGPHNGFPVYYSLTQFNRVYESGSVFDVFACPGQENCVEQGIFRDPETGEPLGIIPRKDPRTDSPVLGDIWVIPNPYERGRVEWDEFTFPHVRFVNLPAEAEIRIFTVSGDLVRVIDHGKDALGQDSGEEDWDLKNGNGEIVVSGVYLYSVKTPDGKVGRGFMAIIL